MTESREWQDWLREGTLRCRGCGQTVSLGPGAAEKTYRDKLDLVRLFGMSEDRVMARLRREPATWKHQECGEVQPYPEPPDLGAFIRGL